MDREQIIDIVRNMPDDQLKDLDDYIQRQREPEVSSKEVISFAGVFEDLDSELFTELTDNLHENRKEGQNRIPKF